MCRKSFPNTVHTTKVSIDNGIRSCSYYQLGGAHLAGWSFFFSAHICTGIHTLAQRALLSIWHHNSPLPSARLAVIQVLLSVWCPQLQCVCVHLHTYAPIHTSDFYKELYLFIWKVLISARVTGVQVFGPPAGSPWKPAQHVYKH